MLRGVILVCVEKYLDVGIAWCSTCKKENILVLQGEWSEWYSCVPEIWKTIFCFCRAGIQVTIKNPKTRLIESWVVRGVLRRIVVLLCV